MELDNKSKNETPFLPLTMNDFKVEFMSEGGFCIDPREYLDGLEAFDYDGQRFYLVGASFNPDLSIPLHCFDPFDPMASENFSTDLTPFLQQRGQNVFNFAPFCGEVSAGSGANERRSSRGTNSRSTTLQLLSAVNRIRIQYGNNDTMIGKRSYHLRSATKKQKDSWKEEGEMIIANYWESKAKEQHLANSSTSLLNDYMRNLNN